MAVISSFKNLYQEMINHKPTYHPIKEMVVVQESALETMRYIYLYGKRIFDKEI